MARW
ncbi:hypothetical protein A2U01_0081227, partial [Trifolium medium]